MSPIKVLTSLRLVNSAMMGLLARCLERTLAKSSLSPTPYVNDHTRRYHVSVQKKEALGHGPLRLPDILNLVVECQEMICVVPHQLDKLKARLKATHHIVKLRFQRLGRCISSISKLPSQGHNQEIQELATHG